MLKMHKKILCPNKGIEHISNNSIDLIYLKMYSKLVRALMKEAKCVVFMLKSRMPTQTLTVEVEIQTNEYLLTSLLILLS